MHGKQETSPIPRVTCTALHAAMVAVAAWIYYGGGAAFFSSLVGRTDPVPGDPGRHLVLMGFALLVFITVVVVLCIRDRRGRHLELNVVGDKKSETNSLSGSC